MSEKLTHRLDFDLDSFGEVCGPQGLQDLMKDLHQGVHARAVVSDLNTRRGVMLATDSGIGRLTVESVHDAFDFHAWGQTEDSYDCWEDEDFLHHQDKTTGSRVRRSQSRNSIIHPGFVEPRPDVKLILPH